ncbi:hypothetical protein KM043_004640 [Ampulex compressa]|nr:hypothetical protein KM043_004640 [Ampulex compressa]
MDERESPFARTQPSRSSIRPQATRKTLQHDPPSVPRQSRQTKEAISPRPPRRLLAPHAALENLKQWELVEGDRGLQVVEKRGALTPPPRLNENTGFEKVVARKPAKEIPRVEMGQLEEKLRAFKDSKIVQPIRMTEREDLCVDSKPPISLDLILKQRKGSAAESTDMLQRLEQQVKAIEMSTLAARTHQLENSTDFGAEIQLRYREHEDLLRNVTDDEAEGASPLHRGDATRNSTGNAGIITKKPAVKLSRTASDTRRGQEAEIPLRAQARVQQTRALVRPILTKKDHRQQQQQQQQQQQAHQHQAQQQQNNPTSGGTLRPLSDIMQKSAHNEKEVDM